jgi:hypothetical protein
MFSVLGVLNKGGSVLTQTRRAIDPDPQQGSPAKIANHW